MAAGEVDQTSQNAFGAFRESTDGGIPGAGLAWCLHQRGARHALDTLRSVGSS